MKNYALGGATVLVCLIAYAKIHMQFQTNRLVLDQIMVEFEKTQLAARKAKGLKANQIQMADDSESLSLDLTPLKEFQFPQAEELRQMFHENTLVSLEVEHELDALLHLVENWTGTQEWPAEEELGNGLTESNFLSNDQANQIANLFWEPRNFELIYRASRDGWGSGDFHNMVDGVGATLTVLRNKDQTSYVFGGYTDIDTTLSSDWDMKTGNGNSFQFFFDQDQVSKVEFGGSPGYCPELIVNAWALITWNDGIWINADMDQGYESYTWFRNAYYHMPTGCYDDASCGSLVVGESDTYYGTDEIETYLVTMA